MKLKIGHRLDFLGVVLANLFILFLIIGCSHRISISPVLAPASSPSLGYEADWTALSGDIPGTNRTITVSGHAVPLTTDSHFISCFGPNPYFENASCKIQAPFKPGPGETTWPEFKAGWLIMNPQPGHWVLQVDGASNGGARASQTCEIDVGTGQSVDLTISLGAGAGCRVN